MKLIVGLGNPGIKYANTRHNIGFLVIDAYLSSITKVDWIDAHKAFLFKHEDIIFLKPCTFMNLSGVSIVEVKDYYKIDISEILIIYDDLYLPEGVFKFSKNKNSGGHNGIKNIIEMLKSKNFLTLRIGIGPRERAESISDYVMEDLSTESLEKLTSLYPLIFSAIKDFSLGLSVDNLQSKYNKSK